MKHAIARLFNRDAYISTGSSATNPWWYQRASSLGYEFKTRSLVEFLIHLPKTILNQLRFFHIDTCTLCRRNIKEIPHKPGWGAKQGVKENFILCPYCYDAYELRKK